MNWECRNAMRCTTDGCTAKAEIEALREKVDGLTQDVSFWNTTFIEAREGYESQLAAMTKLWENEYRLRCEAQARIKELREMVERLRNDEVDLFRLQEQAADLIERLAARVPDGYVVVPMEPTEAMCQAASARCHHPQALYKTAYKAMIAAGEMKP